MRRALLALALVLALGVVGASRFYPSIERVEVSGNARYSAAEIMALAGVRPGQPLLWVNRWRLQPLVADPWILRARVVRYWPDTVSIQVWERTAAIRSGDLVLALDGTVLTDAPSRRAAQGESTAESGDLVVVRGWGEDRLDEAVALVRLLEDYAPKVLSYSPGGFDIELEHGWLFTPDLAALREHWSGFTSQQGKNVYVYPWGVSVQP